MSSEEEIRQLKEKIAELEANIELQYRMNLERQKEIEELMKKETKEVLDKQEKGFFKQKMYGLGAFVGILVAVIGGFVTLIKKLREAKEEIHKLIGKKNKGEKL
jgi:hypothetical protein